MARFYGEIMGHRAPVSRIGTQRSGIQGHLRGWNLGVRVRLWVDKEGRDCVEVLRTGGSSDPSQKEVLYRGMVTDHEADEASTASRSPE